MEHTGIKKRELIHRPGVFGTVTNDDVACWNCRTENGTLYSFTASRVGATFVLEIVGAGGKMIFNGSKPFELTLQLKDKDCLLYTSLHSAIFLLITQTFSCLQTNVLCASYHSVLADS